MQAIDLSRAVDPLLLWSYGHGVDGQSFPLKWRCRRTMLEQPGTLDLWHLPTNADHEERKGVGLALC
jgi:hypothetical protein